MRAAPRGEENSALGFQLLISAAAKKKRKNTFHVHTEELNKLARKVCELTLETGMEMFYIDIDISMEIQFGKKLVTGVGWLGQNFFDPKLTQLAHLLSFASLLNFASRRYLEALL